VGVYLNVTPMIDVLTTLLFFLLLSFGAVIIALINTTVPALGDDSSTSADTPDKTIVTMTVLITDKGFTVSGQADGMTEQEMLKLGKSLPLKVEGGEKLYDYQGLNDFFLEVKRGHEKSDSVVLMPNPDIPYEVLVKTMDATREREIEENGKPKRIPLFPSAVVGSFVK
jgi:biopolymer transport protein ExbD